MLVQYRLALYSIYTNRSIECNQCKLANCKVVELFLLATIRLVSLLGGTLFFS